MKMLLLASHYPPPFVGGSTVYLHSIVSGWAPSDVVVYTNSRPNQSTFDASQSYRIIRSRMLWEDFGKPAQVRMLLTWLLDLLPLLCKERVDIIHAGEAYPSGLVALLLSAVFRRAYVCYAYGEELNVNLRRKGLLGRLKRCLYRNVIEHAAGLVAVSDYTTSLLVRFGADPSRVCKVLPPVLSAKVAPAGEAERTGTRLGLKAEQRVILAAGRLERRKGQDVLIRCMPRILAGAPDAVLVIAGSGPVSDELLELARTHGISDKVILTGHVSDAELSALYDLCVVFAMPHRELPNGDTEGCPTVFLEAGAHGKPVVGGQAGGASDAILDGHTGIIVDGGKTDEVAAAILRLLGDPGLARRLGESGRERVLRELSPATAAGRLLAFNQGIMKRRCRA
jgi:phosphatidylinositol alpha-1,6-mannosyltransferase